MTITLTWVTTYIMLVGVILETINQNVVHSKVMGYTKQFT